MPGKHSTTFPVRRIGFIGGAATLLVVMVAWVAVRSVGPSQEQRAPVMVLPSLPTVPAAEVQPSFDPIPWTSPSPSVAAIPSRTPVRGVRSSPSATRSSAVAVPKPTERATTKPAPPPATSSPTPAAALTARYQVGGSWDSGFVAWVEMRNTGSTAISWKATVTYGSWAGVSVTNVWNAQIIRQGSTNTFTGGTLAPGAMASFGFEATKQVRGWVEPSACAVNGTPCRLG